MGKFMVGAVTMALIFTFAVYNNYYDPNFPAPAFEVKYLPGILELQVPLCLQLFVTANVPFQPYSYTYNESI